MAAGAFVSYNGHTQVIGDGTIILASDTLTAWLVGGGYTPADTHSSFSDISANELSHASYTGGSTGGVLLTTKAITQISGKQWKFASDAIAQAFASTDATFKYVVFGERNATPGSARLLGRIDLNTGGGTITVLAGNTFTLNCPANGWFTMTGAS